MITYEAAEKLVLEYLAEAERNMHEFGSALSGHADQPKLHLVISNVSEHEFGWVFHHNTREYLETGDINSCLVGNASIIVDRADGSFHQLGTARPTEFYVEEYERSRMKNAD